MFIDQVRVHLRSGNGGAGAVSFRQVGRRPGGRPAGGSGGRGGSVVIAVDVGMSTLQDFRRRPHRAAGHGSHGASDLRHGRQGEDLVVPVPPGTVVIDDEDRIVADLVAAGQQVTVLEGGRGGRGNAALISPANRAPSFCEQGEYGSEAWFTLEMKLVADAALIGFPNAGKSTLISRVSAARPKIADYPFTTLVPNLGVVTIEDRSFVMADVPGLVEGAAEGRGLGHEFLRHCERARVLVFLLDPSPLQELSLERQYEVLERELRMHDPGLADRPRVVAVTKRDLSVESPVTTALLEVAPDLIEISSVAGQGLDDLVHRIADAVDQAGRTSDQGEGYVLHRPLAATFEVNRVDGVWVVNGRAAERAVALNDLTLSDAALLASRRLSRLGVDDCLRRAGARDGDEVRIGDLVFEYSEPDDG
ncbi:MAG: GTPase ObgE [bacterium]|nr:GTPase ObgE [bacterium]MDE0351633.1 GTPase ObgE [bacterium]